LSRRDHECGNCADRRQLPRRSLFGLVLFGLMVGLDRILPGHWHDNAVKTKR
jgi:hypothetical protein